ncbi:MAG TPA: secretin N-terminal domain-containing protein [Fimbriimonadaceae bacterium]|jgi:general secretion pathway protein D
MKTKLSLLYLAAGALVLSSAANAQDVPAQAAPQGAAPAAAQAVPAAGAAPQRAPVTTTAKAPNASAKKDTKKKPHKAAKAVPEKKPWQKFKLPNKTLFLDFTDANPDMVISIFARTSGITILKDPSFKVALTVTSAKSVGLNEAFNIFNTVLNLNGYELQKRDSMLVVAKHSEEAAAPAMPTAAMMAAMKAATPAADPNQTVIKTYKLKNASAQQISRVINEVFTPQVLQDLVQNLQNGGGMPQQNPQMAMMMGQQGQGKAQPKVLRASYDDYTNAVVVSAPQKDQDQVAKLIDDLDKTTTQALDTKIFKIKHVPAQEVVDALQEVLNVNAPTGRGAKKQENDQNNNFNRFFNPFGNSDQNKAQGQTATAIKSTNSVIVSATPENMELVKKVIQDVDEPGSFATTTFVLHLENAKATDVATLLTQAFTQNRNNNQDDFSVFFFGGDGQSNRNKGTTDLDEDGNLVNIRDLAGKVTVIADPNTNDLIIATVPANMKVIRNVVDQLDKVADQVMIETVIVEATLDKNTKLGVEWNFLNNHSNLKQNFGLQSQTPALPGLSYTLTQGQYSVFLNALQTDTRFRILDTPRIVTSNNVQAVIDVSQKVPYITSQEATGIGTSLISNYDFLNVGVVLTVTPRITSNGQVSMDVTQSADDLQGFTTYNAPIVDHRQAQATVSVADGQTIILGGIIQTSTNLTRNKVPILGDIPILGKLFQSTTKDVGQTELMVFLTPHIIRSNSDAQKLRKEDTGRLSKESQDVIKHTQENINNIPKP